MKRSLLFLIILLVTATSSCSLFSSSSPAKQYYQIYYNPAKTIGKKISGTVMVKTFDVDKIYRRHNIVYRKSMYEMYYYNTQFWASKPADMITDVFSKHLSESGLFSDVILELERRPDYVLTGRVLALDELQSEEKSYARVSIVFELKDYKTDRSIVTHSFERRKEVKNKETVYVVRAMAEIIEEETDIFFNKIYEALNID
ncbi:MAG TPA: ABC-type transport auxiliary lipoprotein family protein [bacterium]|nr:ABC-type transport auxiliary lipoprotein family protein [bacterium]HPS29848.1 ABC-type transport auxiliary lipoprotein family protein [bacterium]